ncbi:hypothetical protein J6590_037735 [Homalodisca vitripennis]|nr:hypothetical protein J6590_037735 [Homalodisca vitripennis]
MTHYDFNNTNMPHKEDNSCGQRSAGTCTDRVPEQMLPLHSQSVPQSLSLDSFIKSVAKIHPTCHAPGPYNYGRPIIVWPQPIHFLVTICSPQREHFKKCMHAGRDLCDEHRVPLIGLGRAAVLFSHSPTVGLVLLVIFSHHCRVNEFNVPFALVPVMLAHQLQLVCR